MLYRILGPFSPFEIAPDKTAKELANSCIYSFLQQIPELQPHARLWGFRGKQTNKSSPCHGALFYICLEDS